MMDLIVSGIGVLIFTGLTAWDAQAIKRNLLMAPDAGEVAQKIALLGSLSLYLDFIKSLPLSSPFLWKQQKLRS